MKEYEKYTYRNKAGFVYLRNADFEDISKGLGPDEFNILCAAFDRLAAYEETGLLPEPIKAKLSQSKWIPCSERLPGENMLILAQTEIDVCVAKRHKGTWYTHSHFFIAEIIGDDTSNDIIAWQPLPKPYKEKIK